MLLEQQQVLFPQLLETCPILPFYDLTPRVRATVGVVSCRKGRGGGRFTGNFCKVGSFWAPRPMCLEGVPLHNVALSWRGGGTGEGGDLGASQRGRLPDPNICGLK